VLCNPQLNIGFLSAALNKHTVVADTSNQNVPFPSIVEQNSLAYMQTVNQIIVMCDPQLNIGFLSAALNKHIVVANVFNQNVTFPSIVEYDFIVFM